MGMGIAARASGPGASAQPSGPAVRALELLASLQRARERHLVGQLEIGTDRNPAGNTGDTHGKRGKPFANRMRRGLPLGGRVGGQNDLGKVAVRDPGQESVQTDLLRSLPLDRGERAAQDVIQAAVLPRALEDDDIAGLLDHTQQGAIAPRVAAQIARLRLGNVAAHLADAHIRANPLNGPGQIQGFLARNAQKMKGQALGGLVPDPGKSGDLADQHFQMA